MFLESHPAPIEKEISRIVYAENLAAF